MLIRPSVNARIRIATSGGMFSIHPKIGLKTVSMRTWNGVTIRVGVATTFLSICVKIGTMAAKTQSAKKATKVTKKTVAPVVLTPVVTPVEAPVVTPVASAASTEPAKDKTMAIVGLVLNILIIPGLGTLIAGGPELKKTGIWQLVLAIVSVPLMFVFIGIPIYFAVWIWGIVTGVKML